MALHTEPSAIALAGQSARGERPALEARDAAMAGALRRLLTH